MLKFKKQILPVAVLIVMSSGNVSANSDTPPNTLVNDIGAPGSSFDGRIEIQKKVDEISDLQLTPQQVKKLKGMIIDQQRNVSSPYPSTPNPETRSLAINLNPGVTPPALRLSYNMLTTVVFTDQSGDPWPIEKISLNRTLFNDGNTSGNNQSFSERTKQSSGNGGAEDTYPVTNILSLEPLTPTSYGNVAVTLVGLSTPIIFILTTAQNSVDMRIDARVPSSSPTSMHRNHGSNKLSQNIDDITMAFVDGVPPTEAQSLKTNDPSVEAWIYAGDLIVRTQSSIIYPAYSSTVRSASGMSVYRFDAANQSVTISKSGKPVTIYFEH